MCPSTAELVEQSRLTAVVCKGGKRPHWLKSPVAQAAISTSSSPNEPDGPSPSPQPGRRGLVLAVSQPVVAESILDRLANSAHHVHMPGRSYRPNRRPGSKQVAR